MRRKFIYALILLVSLSLVIIWSPVNDVDCNAQSFFASKTPKYQVEATKVVVKPWLGQHYVYAIFMVPDEYKKTPFFVLTVKGLGSFCEKPFGNSQKIDDIYAAPGTHLIKDHIRTRLAFRLIFQGLYNQLNDKQNWTLTFPQEDVAVDG
ncbi:MAG: hypothetical protein ACHBN1_14210 [Heteroscytonema crispum UTEX LB 1556]